MIQPIDLRLNDSKTQDYFAQMQQRQSSDVNLQAHTAEQIVQEVEQKIKYGLEKINSEAKETQNTQNNINTTVLNENLNKVANINSVFFQFEFLENKEVSTEERKKELILKVIDKETKEVLSQYPTEISMKIAKMLNQLISKGQLANAKV